MSNRPRSSLASSSGLPTPGARRKSGIPATSPGSSPTKSSFGPRSGNSDEIASRMAELQAAIKRKDPASYNGGRPESSMDVHQDDATSPVAEQASPRRPAGTAPRPAALRKVSQMGLSNGPDSPAAFRSGTPTTPGPPRPGSSLSSSSYMSAHTHASTSNAVSRARTPATTGGFATPAARRTSDAVGLLSANMARSTSASSSSASGISVVNVGDRVQALGMEGTLRYLGEVQFKPGIWGGIELSGENEGNGKNNGTVQGVQYFACPENCGIFVQAAKIESSMPPPTMRPPSSLGTSLAGPTPRKLLPRPSAAFVAPSTVTRAATKTSTEASQLAASRITAGSRASSYLNLTARDLRAMRGDPKSASPEKQVPSMLNASSSSMISNASSSATTAGATPRPIRSARPSVGGTLGTATPGIPRKSFGGPGTPTPASSIRRPPSSMRTHTPDIPSVPPIPSNLANSSAAAGEKASATGVPTPAARRYSTLSRPSTPSAAARPSSRMSSVSGMRSVSRASSRASMASGTSSRLGHNRDDLGASATDTSFAIDDRTELVSAKESLSKATRDAEQFQLELLEMTGDLKEEKKRVKALQNEVAELKRNAAASRLDEASAIDEREADKEKHSAVLDKLKSQLEDVKRELAKAHSARSETEADMVKRLMEADQAVKDKQTAVREKEHLAEELANLQAGGRQAIEIYQEKVDMLENQLFEEQNALSEVRSELYEAKSRVQQQASLLAAKDVNIDPNSTEAFLAASFSAGKQAEQLESAVAIENDSLKAELEHIKNRMNKMEEELEDSRSALENELEKDKRKRQESGEVAEKLKKEIKDLKEKMDKARLDSDKGAERFTELEAALFESQQTLETERAELEVLRKETSDRPATPATQDGAQQLQSALALAEKEKKDAQQEVNKLRADIESLQEEMLLMEEIKEDAMGATPGKSSMLDMHQAELQAKDRQIRDLQKQLQNGIPTISTEPTNTDQAPSSDGSLFPAVDRDVDGLNLSPSAQIRRKRDSNNSVASSAGSISRKHAPVKDETSIMRDEITGFKILLEQANQENEKLSKTNRTLVEEATRMKDAQRALEKTVNNLMDSMDAQSVLNGSSVPSPLPTRTVSHDILEAEVAELKKRLRDVEKANEREKENLHSEVSQLESLVEAKIFKEDELEQQLADAKKALSDMKNKMSIGAASVNGHQAVGKGRDAKATIKASDGRRSASAYSDTDDDDGNCELCGDPHGIEDCPIFAGSAISPEIPQQAIRSAAGDSKQAFCDDCEEYGHDLDNCPMANEVF